VLLVIRWSYLVARLRMNKKFIEYLDAEVNDRSRYWQWIRQGKIMVSTLVEFMRMMPL